MSRFIGWAIYCMLVVIAWALWRIGDKLDKK